MAETLIENELYKFQNKRMQNNSYVILGKKEAIVIDPSWNGKAIISFLLERKIKFVKILITHAHYDHIVDIDKIFYQFPYTTFYINKSEKHFLTNISKDMVFKSPMAVPRESINTLEDVNQEIELEDKKIKIFFNPGHSAGSTTFFYKNYVFTGDFIFSDCIGRCDLRTGSIDEMKSSLKKFLKIVNDEDIICPGHGQISLFRLIRFYNDEFNEYSK